jgi:hypothetical protein
MTEPKLLNAWARDALNCLRQGDYAGALRWLEQLDEHMPDMEVLVDGIVQAQGEAQFPLGLLRVRMEGPLKFGNDVRITEDDAKVIESGWHKALARLHAVLATVGHPMLDPCTHPEIRTWVVSPSDTNGGEGVRCKQGFLIDHSVPVECDLKRGHLGPHKINQRSGRRRRDP